MNQSKIDEIWTKTDILINHFKTYDLEKNISKYVINKLNEEIQKINTNNAELKKRNIKEIIFNLIQMNKEASLTNALIEEIKRLVFGKVTEKVNEANIPPLSEEPLPVAPDGLSEEIKGKVLERVNEEIEKIPPASVVEPVPEVNDELIATIKDKVLERVNEEIEKIPPAPVVEPVPEVNDELIASIKKNVLERVNEEIEKIPPQPVPVVTEEPEPLVPADALVDEIKGNVLRRVNEEIEKINVPSEPVSEVNDELIANIKEKVLDKVEQEIKKINVPSEPVTEPEVNDQLIATIKGKVLDKVEQEIKKINIPPAPAEIKPDVISDDEELKKINIKKIIYEFIRVNKQNVKDEESTNIRIDDIDKYNSILREFVDKITQLETDLEDAQKQLKEKETQLQGVDAVKTQEVLDLEKKISELQLEYETFKKTVESKIQSDTENDDKKFKEWLLNHFKDSENSDSETINSLRSIYSSLDSIDDSSEFSELTRGNLEKHKKKIGEVLKLPTDESEEYDIDYGDGNVRVTERLYSYKEDKEGKREKVKEDEKIYII
jgi:hypothetical protein